MATGDKVYIADKATLDSVKSAVGSTNDAGGSATTGSLMSKVNSLISSIATHISNWTAERASRIDNINAKVGHMESFTASEIITDGRYMFETETLSRGTTASSVLAIVGTGVLYGFFISYPGGSDETNIISVKIIVDNITIFNKEIINPTASSTTGLITPQSLPISSDNTFFIPVGNTYFNFPDNAYIKGPSSTLDNSEHFIYLPKPVRFNDTLEIVGRASNRDNVQVTYMVAID